MARHILMVTVALLSAAAWGQHHHHPAGYHYASFSGPVSGAVKQISVANTHPPHQAAPAYHQQPQHHHHAPAVHYGGNAVDYVAKPDYSFAYGVEDPHTGNTQSHKESRDGDVVKGEYSVLEPDGSMRTVTYTADAKNGFQATVHNSAAGHGHHTPAPVHHAHPAPDHQGYHHGQDYY